MRSTTRTRCLQSAILRETRMRLFSLSSLDWRESSRDRERKTKISSRVFHTCDAKSAFSHLCQRRSAFSFSHFLHSRLKAITVNVSYNYMERVLFFVDITDTLQVKKTWGTNKRTPRGKTRDKKLQQETDGQSENKWSKALWERKHMVWVGQAGSAGLVTWPL